MGNLHEVRLVSDGARSVRGVTACSPFAAAEGGVLEDMRDSRVIRGVGLEADREDIVAVVAGDVQVLGARFVVL